MDFDYEKSNENINNGTECQSCNFGRVICIQEEKCLLELQKLYAKSKKD